MADVSAALNNSQLLGAVDALATTWNEDTPKIHLFTNSALVPTDSTSISAFDEPVGDWYNSKACTFGTPFIDPDGSITCAINSVQWNNGSTAVTNEAITGYFVTTVPGPSMIELVMARQLVTGPINMGAAYSGLNVDAQVTFQQIEQS